LSDNDIINEKSDRELLLTLFEDLQQIKEKLGIQEKKFITITDYQSEISKYEEFASNELNLNSGTINNHTGVLRKFLEFSNGSITEDTVKDYLDSVDESRQTNNLKALRRFIRDYLKLGNWINDIILKIAEMYEKEATNQESILAIDQLEKARECYIKLNNQEKIKDLNASIIKHTKTINYTVTETKIDLPDIEIKGDFGFERVRYIANYPFQIPKLKDIEKPTKDLSEQIQFKNCFKQSISIERSLSVKNLKYLKRLSNNL